MISWEHVYELGLSISTRPRIKNLQQLHKFNELRNRYTDICNALLKGEDGSTTISEGYDWTAWAGSVRQAFQAGVELGFLAHPTLSSTMVFARRRGVKLTNLMIDDVIQVFGKETAALLIREDYIGLPVISNSTYMTSANRCYHTSHLAMYASVCKKKFWECGSIIEWGGGYGNMARIIRKMNKTITYTIIDLPELLALQYVYLASLEGAENMNIVQSGDTLQIVPGKINFISSELAISKGGNLVCDGFISTWALTESPKNAQDFIKDRLFFRANNILLASLINENNYLSESLNDFGLARIPVQEYKGIGEGHEYWLR